MSGRQETGYPESMSSCPTCYPVRQKNSSPVKSWVKPDVPKSPGFSAPGRLHKFLGSRGHSCFCAGYRLDSPWEQGELLGWRQRLLPKPTALTGSFSSSCQPCPSSEWCRHQHSQAHSGPVSEEPGKQTSRSISPLTLGLIFLSQIALPLPSACPKRACHPPALCPVRTWTVFPTTAASCLCRDVIKC